MNSDDYNRLIDALVLSPNNVWNTDINSKYMVEIRIVGLVLDSHEAFEKYHSDEIVLLARTVRSMHEELRILLTLNKRLTEAITYLDPCFDFHKWFKRYE